MITAWKVAHLFTPELCRRKIPSVHRLSDLEAHLKCPILNRFACIGWCFDSEIQASQPSNFWLVIGLLDVDLELLECVQGENYPFTIFRGPFLMICGDCRNKRLLIQTCRRLSNHSCSSGSPAINVHAWWNKVSSTFRCSEEMNYFPMLPMPFSLLLLSPFCYFK